MNDFNFAPASREERIVFGAERPGYDSESPKWVPQADVMRWVSHMKEKGIKRVCCLLPDIQLLYYQEDLLRTYDGVFGKDNVCWAPVEDYHLCGCDTLRGTVLPFLEQSAELRAKVVVHCSGGIGRTGHALAGWLVFRYGFDPEQAVAAVREMRRNPLEAVYYGTASMDDLRSQLLCCRRAQS